MENNERIPQAPNFRNTEKMKVIRNFQWNTLSINELSIFMKYFQIKRVEM